MNSYGCNADFRSDYNFQASECDFGEKRKWQAENRWKRGSKREKVLAMQCEGALSFCALDTGRDRTMKPCFVELSGAEFESGS